MISKQEVIDLGKAIEQALPEGLGFALLVYEGEAGVGKYEYVSNGPRETLKHALEAFALQNKQTETDEEVH